MGVACIEDLLRPRLAAALFRIRVANLGLLI
jgi:hypothetical protein